MSFPSTSQRYTWPTRSLARQSIVAFGAPYDQAYDYTRKALPEGQRSIYPPRPPIMKCCLSLPISTSGSASPAPIWPLRGQALQRVGFVCHFVETDDDGPVETNADLVMAAIRGSRAERSPADHCQRQQIRSGSGACADAAGAR